MVGIRVLRYISPGMSLTPTPVQILLYSKRGPATKFYTRYKLDRFPGLIRTCFTDGKHSLVYDYHMSTLIGFWQMYKHDKSVMERYTMSFSLDRPNIKVTVVHDQETGPTNDMTKKCFDSLYIHHLAFKGTFKLVEEMMLAIQEIKSFERVVGRIFVDSKEKTMDCNLIVNKNVQVQLRARFSECDFYETDEMFENYGLVVEHY